MKSQTQQRSVLLAWLITLLPLTVGAQNFTPTRDAPEPAGAVRAKVASTAKKAMVAAAHPLATDAGVAILKRGGSAIDAAIAVQMVLNVVEPQSSGIGGGAFMLHVDAKRSRTVAYDGRETAPAAATPRLFLGEDGKPIRFVDAVRSGKSVGVPGVLRMLEAAHAAHGKLDWATLFEPAITLAEKGYPLSARTLQQAAASPVLRELPTTRVLFFNADGTAKAVGTIATNAALADTLKRIQRGGADAFYEGEIAHDIVSAVKNHSRPGTLALVDLQQYRTRISEPLCGNYRAHRVCGMPMPSSGGVAVLQMLGLLSRFELSTLPPFGVEAIHLFAEAGRLAYADREKFAADDRFADVPVAALLDAAYLKERSALIKLGKSMGRAAPGNPNASLRSLAGDPRHSDQGTSHFSIVDAMGNAVSMTSSVDASFGSQIFVRGFFLNNQLTDFSLAPTDATGVPSINAIAPGKRPRSAMSPVIVFNPAGEFMLATGSALGSTIINQVTKTIVGVIDWKMDIQQAIAAPNIGSRNGPTDLEKNTPSEKLAPALQALGHEVRIADIPGGLHGVMRSKTGWLGGADPRREGSASGY
jgi:gamma-glutamyltranspeptidase / glutathione hydrolase